MIKNQNENEENKGVESIRYSTYVIKEREESGWLPDNLFWGILKDDSGRFEKKLVLEELIVSLVFEHVDFELVRDIQ